MSKDMRGLSQFISSVRSADTKEEEQTRVNKELANIRAKFTSTSPLSDYDKRKYVWKLVYMYMLGYDVQVGHMVAIGMVGSKSIMVKQVGYTACSILFTEKSELLRLVIQTLKMDLASTNDVLQSIALVFIANIGNAEFAESLAADVQRILFHSQTRAVVRKKAALALLRLFRKNPDIIPHETDFQRRILGLLDDGNIGVLTTAVTLTLSLVASAPDTKPYEDCVARATVILTKVCFADPRNRSVYKYYSTICPWLQVKLLRLLQYFTPQAAGLIADAHGKMSLDSSEECKTTQTRLYDVLHSICSRTVMTKNVNKNNGDHAILFEAVHLIIAMARACKTNLHHSQMPSQLTDLITTVSTMLAKHLTHPDANYRYLGLDNLTKLCVLPDALPGIRNQQSAILSALTDPDISLRKRALDLVYASCDETLVEGVVAQLMTCLDTETRSMRQDIVLKIVVLLEKYSGFSTWYVDVVMQLASEAGQFMTDAVWFRIVQIITNHPALQPAAVLQAYHRLCEPDLHPNGIRMISYLLGEHAPHTLEDPIVVDQVVPTTLFQRLMKHYVTSDPYTKAIILCAFAKMHHRVPVLANQIMMLMDEAVSSLDVEIQQRASEFMVLSGESPALLSLILDVMPPYDDHHAGLLERKMNAAALANTDRDVWTQIEPDVPLDAVTEPEVEHHADQYEEGYNVNYDAEEEAHEGDDTYPEQRHRQVVNALQMPLDTFIYDSKQLSVHVKTTIDNGSVAKTVFSITNRAAAPISNVVLHLPNSDAVVIKSKPASISSISPQMTERFLIVCHSVTPFNNLQPAKLTFETAASSVTTSTNDNMGAFDLLGLFNDSKQGVPITIQLKLPLLCTSFVSPSTSINDVTLTGDNFLSQWKQLGNQAIAKIRTSQPKFSTISHVRHLINHQSLPLAIIDGCDNVPDNIYLSGSFNSNKRDAQGNPIKVALLMRVETKPDSRVCRVTVNSGSTAVSAAILSSSLHLFDADIID